MSTTINYSLRTRLKLVTVRQRLPLSRCDDDDDDDDVTGDVNVDWLDVVDGRTHNTSLLTRNQLHLTYNYVYLLSGTSVVKVVL